MIKERKIVKIKERDKEREGGIANEDG